MRKMLSLLLIFTLMFSFTGTSFANKLNVENYELPVYLTDENGEPANNVYVTLYSHLEKDFVYSGYTDKKGYIKLKYNPDESLFDNNNIQYIDLTVYAAPQDGDLVVHYFTKIYILDDSNMTEEQKTDIKESSPDNLYLSYKSNKDMNITSKDEYSMEVYKYLVDNKKLTKDNPVYKITKEDKEEMKKQNIIQTDKTVVDGDVNILYDTVTDLGSKPTVVGEVHAIDGLASTFTYSVSSATIIDVGVKTSSSSSWSIGGSLTKSASKSVVFPTFTTTSTSGYGREVKTYYRYECGETISYWTGTVTYEVYAAGFNGGTEWGNYIYGLDGASASSIESGTLGSDWAPYLPGSSYNQEIGEGKRYSIGASFPVIVNGINLGTVTLGTKTDYNTLSKVKVDFGYKYSKYYLYGRNTDWKTIYVSNSSR